MTDFQKESDWIWSELTFCEARVEKLVWSPTYLRVRLNKSHCSTHMGPLIKKGQNRLYFFRGGSDPLTWAEPSCVLLIRLPWPAACFFGAACWGWRVLAMQTRTHAEKINKLKRSKTWAPSVDRKRKRLSRWPRRERHLCWAHDK